MEIGKPQRRWQVEPVEAPAETPPADVPEREEPATVPRRERETVPA